MCCTKYACWNRRLLFNAHVSRLFSYFAIVCFVLCVLCLAYSASTSSASVAGDGQGGRQRGWHAIQALLLQPSRRDLRHATSLPVLRFLGSLLGWVHRVGHWLLDRHITGQGVDFVIIPKRLYVIIQPSISLLGLSGPGWCWCCCVASVASVAGDTNMIYPWQIAVRVPAGVFWFGVVPTSRKTSRKIRTIRATRIHATCIFARD